jgi:hypothetical protein
VIAPTRAGRRSYVGLLGPVAALLVARPAAAAGDDEPASGATLLVGAFVGGISGDLGIPLGPGNLGVRMFLDASGPGPFYELALVPRYRIPFVLGTEGLRSVEPWLGIGLGVDFKDAREPHPGGATRGSGRSGQLVRASGHANSSSSPRVRDDGRRSARRLGRLR